MTIETTGYLLPTHWACALINGDLGGLDSDDLESLRLFTEYMVKEWGQCLAIDVSDEDFGFMKYHDASEFGVLACDVSNYTFDITQR